MEQNRTVPADLASLNILDLLCNHGLISSCYAAPTSQIGEGVPNLSQVADERPDLKEPSTHREFSE